ncbi:MAG: hypothetical protein IPO27_16900 [Bacteroidetes bacterium]|nr:hypothetical protein [Bacteroidota bacterium]
MRLVALALVFFISTVCAAQQDSSVVPKWSLVTKPFYIFDPLNQGLEAGIGYRFNNIFSAQFRGGPMFSIYKAGPNFKNNNYAGYRIAAEVQLNVFRTSYESYYVGAEYLYKDFTRTKQEWFLRMGNKYQQLLLLSKFYDVHGLHIKAGLNTINSSRRIAYEFYGAVGARIKYVSFSELPDDARFLEQSNFENETIEGKSGVPVLFLGMIMHFRFTKNY